MDKKRQPVRQVNKKKRNIIIGSCIAVVAVIVAVILVIFLGKDKETEKPALTEDKNSLANWDNRIADLENEPVSDSDVVYKDSRSDSDKPYLIQVNKSQNCITIYKKDAGGKYTTPYKSMICSTGFDTPSGEFETSDKYQWKIVNGNVWAQSATRIVGNVLFHSMPYVTNSKDTLIAQYYNQLGSTLSASCIRLSAKDAEWIMKNCPSGTKVQIYESDQAEPLERPQSIIVPEDAVWDPTDTDTANPYHSVQIAFEGMEPLKVVERGTQINYMDGITIQDTCGNDISSQVKVTSAVNAFTLGTYEVKYYAEDAAGKVAEGTVNYQIVDTAPPQFSGLKETMNFSSVADVNQDNILKGVYVIDNNEILDNSRIVVTIPTIVEGNNAITLSVTDDYNNTTTAIINASVYVKPPVISLKPGMETIIPLTQNVDKAYALLRVTAIDDGATMPAERITVSITPTEWGYSFKYTATDDNGYAGVLYDSVTYVEYTINPPKELKVTDITDKEQLLKGVELNNNLGGSLEPTQIQVSVKNVSESQYQVNYSYTYTSPRGSKTATATALINFEGIQSSAQPSEEPKESVLPLESGQPQASTEPENPERNRSKN